jgi:hypothetical protein
MIPVKMTRRPGLADTGCLVSQSTFRTQACGDITRDVPMPKPHLEKVLATATDNATHPHQLPTSCTLFGVIFVQTCSEFVVRDLQREFAAAVGALVADRRQLRLLRCARAHSVAQAAAMRMLRRFPLQPGRRRERPCNEYGGDDTYQVANDLHYFCPPLV